MHDPIDTMIIPRALAGHHRLAAIVDILAQRCYDEPDCDTPLPTECCTCGKYRLVCEEETVATELEDDGL